MEASFVLVADVLGFSEIVKNLDDAAQERRIESWVSLVEEQSANSGVDNYQLISDTIFVGTDLSVDGLRRLLDFSSSILSAGIRQSIPIRGGIARGRVRWSPRVTHGAPIVRAHQLEASQDWLGISCEYAFPELEPLWDYELVCRYRVPTRPGPEVLPAVCWSVPSLTSLKVTLSTNGLLAVGQQLSAAVRTKLANTADFGSYLDRMRSNPRSSANTYEGIN